ncbi:MAG: zinc-ribbon domain-containing protein, partial [Azospira sp.]|nr:zinc-ribbon domain-containing protein [Azospira sp.]
MILTRCPQPECQTTFRVTPEQLKARGGKVRCGQCQHVFNALEHLLDEGGEE